MIRLIQKVKNNLKNSIKINSKFVRFDSTSLTDIPISRFCSRVTLYSEKCIIDFETYHHGNTVQLRIPKVFKPHLWNNLYIFEIFLINPILLLALFFLANSSNNVMNLICLTNQTYYVSSNLTCLTPSDSSES